jgi:hypothetical protein
MPIRRGGMRIRPLAKRPRKQKHARYGIENTLLLCFRERLGQLVFGNRSNALAFVGTGLSHANIPQVSPKRCPEPGHLFPPPWSSIALHPRQQLPKLPAGLKPRLVRGPNQRRILAVSGLAHGILDTVGHSHKLYRLFDGARYRNLRPYFCYLTPVITEISRYNAEIPYVLDLINAVSHSQCAAPPEIA